MQNGLLSVPMENASDSHDLHDSFNSTDRTIAQQNNIVQDQNSIIESIRADLAEIKRE
jgi:hypothetical protein